MLFRYPVKSMGGETPDYVDLVEEGVAGDRHWALRDEQRGGITGAKRFPGLPTIKKYYISSKMQPLCTDHTPLPKLVLKPTQCLPVHSG